MKNILESTESGNGSMIDVFIFVVVLKYGVVNELFPAMKSQEYEEFSYRYRLFIGVSFMAKIKHA